MRRRNVKYLQYLLHLGTVLNSWLVLNASTAGLEITRVTDRQTRSYIEISVIKFGGSE